MDPNYEDLALLRAHEPGLRPPTRHLPPRERRRARRHVASVLRRVANRLDHWPRGQRPHRRVRRGGPPRR